MTRRPPVTPKPTPSHRRKGGSCNALPVAFSPSLFILTAWGRVRSRGGQRAECPPLAAHSAPGYRACVLLHAPKRLGGHPLCPAPLGSVSTLGSTGICPATVPLQDYVAYILILISKYPTSIGSIFFSPHNYNLTPGE